MAASRAASRESPHPALPGIFDGHVHCFPPEAQADPEAWARTYAEPHWLDLVRSGPQGWADPEALLRHMDACGIERALLQSWYWETPAAVQRHNDWHAELLQRYPERFCAFAGVHPAASDPEASLKASCDWGACGVGELLPQIQSSEGWAHPGWERIMETLEALGWPLTLHVTEAAGHAYPGRVDTPLQEVFTQIQKWPKQRWILAHWGGGLPFFFMNPRVRKFCANVWFDTAASLLLYDARIWSAVLNWVGPDRIIFGSDYPLKLRPSLSAADGWVALRDQFLTEFGEAHLLQKVGMDNLTSLLQGSMKKS